MAAMMDIILYYLSIFFWEKLFAAESSMQKMTE